MANRGRARGTSQWTQQESENEESFVEQELQSLETLLTIDESFKQRQHNQAAVANEHVGSKNRNYAGSEDGGDHENGATKAPLTPPAVKPQAHVRGTGLEFESLTYTVLKKQKKDGEWIKREVNLLHGITGYAAKGQVTAVMGPSGAGKSTFLDALAGRIASGALGGLTTVDGQPMTPSLIKRMSAYVMQDDQLFPMLTVWETLWFAAEVRLDPAMSRNDKRDRVMKLIDQLGLTHAQNTYIGDAGTRGISGGEKRRVSIGVDIIHGPALLFLDEPTSGLDSTSAFSVIERVHDIAVEGSTVVLTIHQPSYRIVQLLNRLIILARGQLIYSGSSDYLSTHLNAFGREVPRGENSIEYLLDLIQEYEASTLGLQPLVQFNIDGVKPRMDGISLVARTPKYSFTSSKIMQSPMPADRSMFSKSPLAFKSSNKVDDRIEAMEVGTPEYRHHGFYDDVEDAYDHSLTREAPLKLASLYYSGFVENLADKFKSPMLTPMRTPGRWSLDHSGILADNTPARTPIRTPVHGQSMKDQSVSREFATSTPGAGSSDYIATEGDYYTDDDIDSLYGPKFANNWSREVLVLTARNFKNIKRTPELFLSRQMVLTVMGFMMATLFKKAKPNLDGVTEILSFFIFTVCLFFFSSNDAVPTFIQERFIYIRETSHNAYRASSYVMAGVITYLPFLAVQAMTYTLITWFAMGFQQMGWDSFLFFWLVLYVSLMCTGSFVMFISALVPNFILGYAAVIAFTALFFLTCGYFLKRSSIPPYWIWLHYISTLKYPYEALLLNEFGNPNHMHCYANNPLRNNTCVLYGSDLLDDLAVKHGPVNKKYESLGMLFAWAVFYRILFYFVLRFASKNQRS